VSAGYSYPIRIHHCGQVPGPSGGAGPAGPTGPQGPPGLGVTYVATVVGPTTYVVSGVALTRIPYNTKLGAVTIQTASSLALGATIVVYDVGGFVGNVGQDCTMSDAGGLAFQDPQGQGLVLVQNYLIQSPGSSVTWTKTQDTVSGNTFWAVTG
jgi:hypothetical protein